MCQCVFTSQIVCDLRTVGLIQDQGSCQPLSIAEDSGERSEHECSEVVLFAAKCTKLYVLRSHPLLCISSADMYCIIGVIPVLYFTRALGPI